MNPTFPIALLVAFILLTGDEATARIVKPPGGAKRSSLFAAKQKVVQRTPGVLSSKMLEDSKVELWSRKLLNTLTKREPSCSSNQFRCERDDRCIPLNYICDGDSDCSDRSDEVNCDTIDVPDCNGVHTTEVRPTTTQPTAPDVPNCNGVHPTEVRPTTTQPTAPARLTCLSTYFACADNSKCVRQSYVCDGDRDCPDSSDERNCAPRTCPPEAFQCVSDGRCIRLSYVCDGDGDCADRSDEANCDKPDNEADDNSGSGDDDDDDDDEGSTQEQTGDSATPEDNTDLPTTREPEVETTVKTVKPDVSFNDVIEELLEKLPHLEDPEETDTGSGSGDDDDDDEKEEEKEDDDGDEDLFGSGSRASRRVRSKVARRGVAHSRTN